MAKTNDGNDDYGFHDNEEDRLRPSPDDALEPPDDIYSPEVDEERLEEDFDTPAKPANPHSATPKNPDDHPTTDTNIEFEELYNEGLTGATDYDAQEEATDNEELYPLEPEEEEGDEDRPG